MSLNVNAPAFVSTSQSVSTTEVDHVILASSSTNTFSSSAARDGSSRRGRRHRGRGSSHHVVNNTRSRCRNNNGIHDDSETATSVTIHERSKYNKRSNSTAMPNDNGTSQRMNKSGSSIEKRSSGRNRGDSRDTLSSKEVKNNKVSSGYVKSSCAETAQQLLNFNYGLPSNVSGGGGGGGGGGYSSCKYKGYGGKRYNKERFVQASCQFRVLASKDYTAHLADPDIIVDWDTVVEVRLHLYSEPVCPICLECPKATKMTRCGHVFCWTCLLHYIDLGEKSWRKCPLCVESVAASRLKPVSWRIVPRVCEGDSISFRLMKRLRHSVVALPVEEWRDYTGPGVPKLSEVGNTEVFLKLISVSQNYIVDRVLLREATELYAVASENRVLGEFEEEVYFFAAVENITKQLDVLRVSGVDINKRILEIISKVKDSSAVNSLSNDYVVDNYGNVGSSCESQEAWPQLVSKVSAESSLTPPCNSTHDCDITDGNHYDAPFSDEDICEDGTLEGATSLVTSSARLQLTDDLCPPPFYDTYHSPIETKSGEKEVSTTCMKKSKSEDGVYFFYQASDGQQIFLHPSSMRCIVAEAQGVSADCPTYLSATVTEVERILANDEWRDKHRGVSHVSLTSDVAFAVVDVRPLVSRSVLKQFSKELRLRENRRMQRKRQERAIEKRTADSIYSNTQNTPQFSSFLDFPSPSLATDTDNWSNPEMPLIKTVVSDLPPQSAISSSFSDAIRGGYMSNHEENPPLTSSDPNIVHVPRTPVASAWTSGASKAHIFTVSHSHVATQPVESITSSAVPEFAVPEFRDSVQSSLADIDITLRIANAEMNGVGKKKRSKKVLFTAGGSA